MIKPNASAAERESPYYKANEPFCSEFERYVLSKKRKPAFPGNSKNKGGKKVVRID